MTPDAEKLKRAEAQLRADHRPRQLQHEPRISRADEQDIVDRVHSGERRAVVADAHVRIAAIRREVEALTVTLGRAAPGNHRDTLRMIRRALATLERSVQR